MNQADPFFFASGRRVPGFFEARGGGPRLVAFVDAKISSDPRRNFPSEGNAADVVLLAGIFLCVISSK